MSSRFKIGDIVKDSDYKGLLWKVIGVREDENEVDLKCVKRDDEKDYRINENATDIDLDDSSLSLFKRAGKEIKVKYLLKYDLDADPVEEFSTKEEVKARIIELVEDRENNGLKTDSIIVYEVSKSHKIIVDTTVQIKGI